MAQQTIVFDFGGVIFNSSVTDFYRERFQEKNHSEEKLEYFLENVFTKDDRSLSNTGNAYDLIERKSAEYPVWAEEIKAFGADHEFIKTIRSTLPGTVDLLKELKEEGYRIVGLTNWHGDTFDTLPAAFPEVLGYFDNVVVSGKTGLRKPNAEIFRLAHQEYGSLEPSSIYYFDDKEKNIETAINTVGWNGFVFKDANTVRNVLGLVLKPL